MSIPFDVSWILLGCDVQAYMYSTNLPHSIYCTRICVPF